MLPYEMQILNHFADPDLVARVQTLMDNGTGRWRPANNGDMNFYAGGTLLIVVRYRTQEYKILEDF